MCDTELIDSFTLSAHPNFVQLFTRLASVIGGVEPRLECAVKWGRLTFALDGDYHHWICGIGVTKKAVVLTFHFGGLLRDPTGLLRAGASRFGRKLEYRVPEDVNETAIVDFMSKALGRLEYFKDNWKAIQAGSMAAGG